MSKCTECTSRTIAGVLNVVTLCGLVNLGMKLLLRSCMAVLTGVSGLAAHRVAPFVTGFHIGTGRRAILVFLGATPFVLVVMKLRTSVALSAQPGGFLARFCLVIGQDVGGVQPLWVVV